MCGIAGLAGGNHIEREVLLTDVLDRLHHRGPDSRGEFNDSFLSMGMTRLSIVDVEGGTQPVKSDSGLVLVLNGEIYNHNELRRSLEHLGVRFKSRSDSEVALCAFDIWGLSAVQRFVGMFAIALYDPSRSLLYLIRDRFGKKPLYFWTNPSTGSLIFASELRALMKSGLVPQELSEQAIYDYLTFRFVPISECIWRGVKKVPPASIVTINLATLNYVTEPFWTHQSVTKRESGVISFDQAVEEFRRQFDLSVELRMSSSDVPVGILLSGGIDSSSIAVSAAKSRSAGLRSFGVSFENSPHEDEEEFAALVAKHLGIRHSHYRISQSDFMNGFFSYFKQSDEPLADLSTVALYHLMGHISGELKVVLSGEGADEILAGYDLNQYSRKLYMLGVTNHLPDSVTRRLLERYRGTVDLLGESQSSNLSAALKPYITRDWSEDDLKVAWEGATNLRNRSNRLHQWYEESLSDHPIGRILEVYSKDWLTEDLLTKADRASMAHSVEIRCPFLDHNLTDWVSTVDPKFLCGRPPFYSTKRILRAYSRQSLPPKILKRPKMGFPVPVYGWLQLDEFRSILEQVVESPFLDQFISKSSRENNSTLARNGNKESQRKIWNLLVLDEWGSSSK